MKITIEHSPKIQVDIIGFDIEASKVLLSSLEKSKKEIEKKYLKYKDIQDSGEASTRQQDLLMKYNDELENIEAIIYELKLFI